MEKEAETKISVRNENVDRYTKMLRGETGTPDYIKKAFAAEFYAWPNKKAAEIEQRYERRVRCGVRQLHVFEVQDTNSVQKT